MEWIATLRGQIVALDTSPLIYFMERNPKYITTVRPFFQALDEGDFSAVTSLMTLLEVLVYPLRNNNNALAQQYRDILFNTEYLRTLPFTADIAEEAARLRATYNLRTPDAVQMATAIHAGASLFLTNDIRLPSLPSLQVLVIDQLQS